MWRQANFPKIASGNLPVKVPLRLGHGVVFPACNISSAPNQNCHRRGRNSQDIPHKRENFHSVPSLPPQAVIGQPWVFVAWNKPISPYCVGKFGGSPQYGRLHVNHGLACEGRSGGWTQNSAARLPDPSVHSVRRSDNRICNHRSAGNVRSN